MSGAGGTPDLARLQAELALHLEGMSVLSSRFEALRGEWNAAVAVRTDLLDRVAVARLAAGGDPDWEWLLAYGNGAVAQEALGLAARAVGLEAEGYYPDTMQNALSLCMAKDDLAGLETTIAGIHAVLPHIRPDKEGYARFGVMESTFNSHGSWTLRVASGSGQCILSRNRWDHVEFSGIENAVAYVQQNHWREEAPSRAPTR